MCSTNNSTNSSDILFVVFSLLYVYFMSFDYNLINKVNVVKKN